MPLRAPGAVVMLVVAAAALLKPLPLNPVTAVAQGDCVRLVDYEFNTGAYSWAEAYAAGTVCRPSDGNVYDPEYWSGGGASGVPYIVLGNSSYVERGCNGDYVYAYAYVYVDADGDNLYILDSYARAKVGAPPCGAT